MKYTVCMSDYGKLIKDCAPLGDWRCVHSDHSLVNIVFELLGARCTEELSEAILSDCRLFIIPDAKEKFSVQEIDCLRRFIADGNSVLVLMSEGGESASGTNINFLLEEYGIACNNDSVIRTIFYKYFDPKEALISDGILNRALAWSAGKMASNSDDGDNHSQALTLIYPYGATLSTARLAIPVLSTGSVCFPSNRPICAFHRTETNGKLAVLGSVQMFTDQYIVKEENFKFWDVLMKYLIDDDLELNLIDAKEPDVMDKHHIPDHIALSQQIKVCVQESEIDFGPHTINSSHSNFLNLFDHTTNHHLHSIDLSMWPNTIRAYDELALKHEPLSLIVPHFEVPQPVLEPAVFPPNFRELEPPQLELFDLDDMFSSIEVRLAQLTNTCNEDQLEYYLEKTGEIFNISRSLPANERGPRHIIEYVINRLIEFKKLNQDDEDQMVIHTQTQQMINEPNIDEHNFSDIDNYD